MTAIRRASFLAALTAMPAVGVADAPMMAYIEGQALADMARDYSDDPAKQGAEDFAFMYYVLGGAEVLSVRREICLPSGSTGTQIAAVAAKSIRARPEVWHLHGTMLLTLALTSAFPCPPGVKKN